MSEISIKVENLGKSYLVGHNSKNTERYTALRDVISNNTKNLARKTRDMIMGKPIVQGDEVEEFWALKNIDFNIKQGDRVGIIGRNGAGKSTLLKLISRITEPTTGKIVINGRIASLLEVGTGFHPELTGRENIFLNGAILGMNRTEIKKRFDEIVEFSEIEKFIDTPVKRYSSGMYVRLAFGVAAHLETEILILDEVLAVGDAKFQEKCFGKMEEVATNGKTVLFVSHNISAIEKFCTSGIYLENGQINSAGCTSDVIDKYIRSSKNNHGKTIISDATFYQPIDEINRITINNSTDSDIYLNDKTILKIEIDVHLSKSVELEVELLVKDATEKVVAVFLPGHLYGNTRKFQKGRNTVTETIKLPNNLNHGTYYMDLNITLPGVMYYMKAPLCARLHINGVRTARGNTLSYESSGLLCLKRPEHEKP